MRILLLSVLLLGCISCISCTTQSAFKNPIETYEYNDDMCKKTCAREGGELAGCYKECMKMNGFEVK